VPATPDRRPGPLEEDDEIRLASNAIGPTQAGALNYDGSIFQFRDAVGTFDPRTGGGISETQHKILRQLTHLAEEGGPWEGFASGAFQETLPSADPFPTSVIWWTSAAKTEKIVEEQLVYNANKTITTDVWKVYAVGGALLFTVTDTIAYSGVFETSRTRTIV
jgi:hypothetical protein